MSLTESKVAKLTEYIDTNYLSGDSNGMKYKLKQFYQEENNNTYRKQECSQGNPYEENNNEIDEITKEFSEMGCIVDAVKRPPNICIETCVYEEPESDDEHDRSQRSQNNDEDDVHYSDEFEEADLSDIELEKPKSQAIVSNGNSKTQVNKTLSKSSVKLSKSQSCMSQCASQKPGSVSGRSTDYGSVSVPKTRRINMSFPNDRLREIERHNHILLNKILSARNKRKSSIPPPRDDRPKKPLPPAAVQRRNLQRKIDHDNLILLKKIQRAKSSACSIRR
ncbi:cilia- and flagella-associated protein 97-like isoform X2 [Maniola jurtina]|nr:cilia- and flagella-associated protein 97-like isoform X2 [Maniola jurtina]XP_045778674.1 cilia- and flagella-associated protein 97-like isoform X2 [Maniola jurtina]